MFLNFSSLLTYTNITYSEIYENLLVQLGSTYFTDTCFSLASLISLFGICFNLFGIRILFNEEFNSARLFGYMKVYLITSAIMCTLILPMFTLARRFIFAEKIYGPFYGSYIYGPLANLFYMFSSLIDIAITLDRISLFTRKLNFIKKYSLISICVASLICCALVNVPFYFIYCPDELNAI
jgi:hypothetical protein